MLCNDSWRKCLLLFILLPVVTAKCLDEPDDKIRKHFNHDGRNIPITLAMTDRVSHNISNTILEILLKEVLGYTSDSIQYKPVDFMNSSSALEKISGCSLSSCKNDMSSLPETMVNLEVWSGSGLEKQQWVETKSIIDAGPLGPQGRFGWFMSTEVVDALWHEDIIIDHWRSFFLMEVSEEFSLSDQLEIVRNMTLINGQKGKHLCDSDDCVNGIYYGPGCQDGDEKPCAMMLASFPDMYMKLVHSQIKALSIPVNVAWIGDNLMEYVWQRSKQKLPILFFTPEPSPLTANGNFTRVKFPWCQKSFDSLPNDCDFPNNPFSKVVWFKLEKETPDVFHIIQHMTFTNSELELMLQWYKLWYSVNPVACTWLRANREIWTSWIPEQVSKKKTIYLGALFPMTGLYWMQPGLVQGAELALSLVNQSPHVLPKYSLEMIVTDSQCLPDVAMRAFIKYITNNTVPIAGVLGPGCSDEAEPIAALSKHFNMVMVSYGAEAGSLADRDKYPFFYRTIPQVDQHRYVYEKFFKAMSWNQVGALADGLQELPVYHLVLQDHLQDKGVSVVVKHKIRRGSHSLDVSQIFADLRERNVKVIIADFFVLAARAVMCEAYRQKMTAHEGYVWFLPSWYSADWWDVDFFNSPPNYKDIRPQESVPCTTMQMEWAIEGHFQLTKTFPDPDNTFVAGDITVGQYKQLYAERVGKADVDSSPYASYVYDAVWVYAKALDQLLHDRPESLNMLHSKTTTENLVSEIGKTQFQGVSGYISFDGSDRSSIIFIQQFFVNETRTVGQYIPSSKEEGGILEIYESKMRWLTDSGLKPTDGHPEHEECIIENFRSLFGVSCEMAIVIANIIGFSLFAVAMLTVLIIIKIRYSARVKATHKRMKELGLLSSDFSQCLSLDEWELARSSVVLNRRLGQGAFGTVYGGEVNMDTLGWVACAVKTLKVGSTVEEKVDFLSEAELMKRFRHPNIVQLLGVCSRGEPVHVVMEFLLHGDLKTFLLSRRSLVGQEVKEADDVNSTRLTQMAVDIASGLKYLHDQKYVHRDLASRNCLVHANQTVKIGDFGMTRLTYESGDYYRFTKKGMLPVRWMSPESLWDGIFTYKSDIWSYGIVLYEIVTFGSFPYQGMSNNQVLEYVKNGSKLILPKRCPEDLQIFIHSCLSYNEKERMDLQDIIDSLMKNPEFLTPTIDAPTTSFILEDPVPENIIPQPSPNCIPQSQVTNCSSFLNRLSLHAGSQELLNAIKRFSGSQGIKISPQKPAIKTFVPAMFGRPRSNSIGSPQSPQPDDFTEFLKEIQSISSQGKRKDKPKRYSEEFHRSSSYHKYLPLLNNAADKGDNTSDYFSDNSKELCTNVKLEMCETVTSV